MTDEVPHHRAPNCPSVDGKHETVFAEPPFYEICTICGERFALISETVLNEAGIEVREREVEIVSKQ